MQFSIIVPVYNVEQYLPQCLDSILGQDFRDFELLVVDDGSTDNSGAICDDYARRDSRIRVFHQKNQGPSQARNNGLEHAKGIWIVFVDSDDWIAPEALRILNRQIEKTSADMYCFNTRKVTESGSSIVEDLIFHVENDMLTIDDGSDLLTHFRQKLLQYKLGWEVCFRIFRRDIIERNHIRFSPTLNYAEDLLFTAKYMVSVRKIGVVCNVLYFYRQRGNSLVHSKGLDLILPTIFQIAKRLYYYLIKKRSWKMVNEFPSVYFSLLNFQLQHTFLEETDTQVAERLKPLEIHPLHRKWVALARKKRADYRKEMFNHQWL